MFAPEGSASLAGAEFTVRYYDDENLTKEEAESIAPTREWVFKTDDLGIVKFEEAHKVSGDDLYIDNDTGKPAFPCGTVIYWESKAPTGYLLPQGDDLHIFVTHLKYDTSQLHGVRVEGDIFPTENNLGDSPTIQKEQVIRGGIEMPKLDRETQGKNPLGGATLEGAEFSIKNKNSHAVVVDEKSFSPEEDVLTLTVLDGIARSAEDALPYGH